jgi:transaldolase
MDMTDAKKSPMERFAATNPTCEIWWDSSPLVYDTWSRKTIAETPMERRAEVAAWHARYYVCEKPLEQLFRGVTTNPPLSWAAVGDCPAFWREWAVEEKRKNPKVKAHEVWWKMYKEIVRRGAEKYFGVYNRSGYKYGYLSGQVDPRDYANEAAMKAQALEISRIATNVMIKIPGTAQGVKVIKFLTSKGISTNATLCFTVPQYVAVAEAVKEGVQLAKKKGVTLKRWRSVITAMTARYEELGTLKAEAEQKGIVLTPADIRWSSIAMVKYMLKFLREGKYPSKMLLASMREGPVVDGKMRIWHFEKLAGADAVYTCPGKYIKMVDDYCYDIEFDPGAWAEPVPDGVLSKLMKLKYFREAYEPYGLKPEQFNRHPSTQATAKEFSKATDAMEKFIAESLKGK